MNPEEQKKPGTPQPQAQNSNLGTPEATSDRITSKYGPGALRTYESDIARALSQKNVSLTKIAIAENVKKGTPIQAQNFVPKGQTPPPPQQPGEKTIEPLVQSQILPSRIEAAPRVGPSDEVSPFNTAAQQGIQQQAPVPPTSISPSGQTIQKIQPAPAAQPAYIPPVEPLVPPIAPRVQPQIITPVPPVPPKPPEAVIRQTIKPPSHLFRNTILFLLSIAFIGGGVYGGYYFYKKSPLSLTTAPIYNTPTYKGIITSDTQKEFSTSSTTQQAVTIQLVKEKANLVSRNFPVNSVEEILLTTIKGTGRTLLSAPEVLSIIASNPPSTLARSLAPQSMFGFIGTTGGPAPFAIFISTYFQSSFTGMLAWEQTIFSDWQPLFISTNETTPRLPTGIPPSIPEQNPPIATSTATSSASTTPQRVATTTIPFISSREFFNQGYAFEDLTYRNKDLRILKKGDKVIYLYSFIDKQHLVITTSLSAFDEILRRFDKETYIR